MSELRLHLVVQLYGMPSSASRERILKCIVDNSRLSFIQKITVVCEQYLHDFGNKNIDSIKSSTRATYADLLRVANARSSDVITHFAIANSDIFLSGDILRLMERISQCSTVAAVTRTELSGHLFPHPRYSQDLWLFKIHNPTQKVLNECEYRLGIAGCEHLFALALYAHGYDIWNPCHDCKIVHNDPNPAYHWDDRYYGSYLYLPPCTIADVEFARPRYELRIERRKFEQLLP